MSANLADSDGGWSIDRRIPIALIVAIIASWGGGAWWLASVDSRVTVLKERQDAQGVEITRFRASQTQNALQLERLDERSKATLDAIRRVESKLDERAK